VLRESLRLALASFRVNRLRSALSLIGIVIGVASVVAVTSLAGSGTSFMRKQYEGYGLEAIQVYPGWDRGSGAPLVRFDRAMVADIAASVPGAKAVLPRAGLGGSLAAGRNKAAAQITAVSSAYIESMGAAIDTGRSFDAVDEYRLRPVVVLGSGLAKDLFPEGDPAGKEITASIGGKIVRLEVIGALAHKDSFFADDWDKTAYVTYSFASGRISADLGIELLTVVAQSKDAILGLGESLKRYFLEKTGNPEAANVISPRQWLESDMAATKTVSAILTGIAAISLLVGGIGIMNIMLVSVTERKREIGIRKALGATPRHIRAQFLVESSVLTLAGGVIGLGLGALIGWFAVKGFKWPYVASADTAALAFAVSVGTGIFFGLYPAARASKLDPVEALAAE
jgi:putative ABC transport system permease protein